MKHRSLGALVILLAYSSAYAADGFETLPATANAVLRIDVQQVLNSEYAKSNNWRSMLTKQIYDRPLAVPANATQLTTAAMLDLESFDPRWQASLIQSPGKLNTERLAARGGGFVDKIASNDVVVMPNNTCYIQRGSDTIGAFWPAQRQSIARWLGPANQPRGLGERLVDGVKTDAPYVIAIDTSEAYSAAGIFHAIRDGGFPSLDKFDGDLAQVAETLASVNRIQLTARFGAGIQGEITADFGKNVDLIGPYAKQLVSDAIAEAGLSSQTIQSWSFTAKGQQIKGSGAISAEMLQFLGTRFTPPSPPEHLIAEGKTATADRDVDSQASVQYFKAISRIGDNLNFGQASLKQTAQYLRNQALLIERMPVLNVDPALQDWGSQVATAFNSAAQRCLTGQNQAIASAESVPSPTAGTDYGTGYSSTASAQSRADFRNAQSQRREAGASQRTQTVDAVTALMGTAFAPRNDLKKQMTDKYKAEF